MVFTVQQGSCRVTSSGLCVTTPNFPKPYPNIKRGEYVTPGSQRECSILVLASGYITASAFDTEFSKDFVVINGHGFSGINGPVDEHVSNRSELVWYVGLRYAVDERRVWPSGWNLCWSATRAASIETLSVARNHLLGTTESLEDGNLLQTLILSGNLLSCDSARLDSADRLGRGSFEDPRAKTFLELGRDLARCSLLLDAPHY